MNEVLSPSNPKFKIWLSLLGSKGIKEHGLCLASGLKIIKELPVPIETLLVKKGNNRPSWIDCQSEFDLAGDLFDSLDILGTHEPLAVVATPQLTSLSDHSVPEGLEIVLPFGDPSNLGAAIRSAAAFGATKILLTQEAANPFLPRTIKASSGSVFQRPLWRTKALPEIHCTHGLDMEGDPLTKVAWPKDVRIAIGEEGPGLPAQFRGRRVKIPMAPGIESLNAAVASALALFSYRQQHPLV